MAHTVRTPGAGTALYVFTLFLGVSLGSQISALVGYDLAAAALTASHALTRGRGRTGAWADVPQGRLWPARRPGGPQPETGTV